MDGEEGKSKYLLMVVAIVSSITALMLFVILMKKNAQLRNLEKNFTVEKKDTIRSTANDVAQLEKKIDDSEK